MEPLPTSHQPLRGRSESAAMGVLWPGTLGGTGPTEGVLTVIVALTALLVWRIVRGSFEPQGSSMATAQ